MQYIPINNVILSVIKLFRTENIKTNMTML